MRSLILSTAAITVLSAASVLGTVSNADAKSRGFETTIEQSLSVPVKLEIVLSESMQQRANGLPEDITKRNNSRLRSGFSNNGYYGEKALNELIEDVREEFTEDFEDRGLVIDDNAAQTLLITIVDAKNNRPTFEQMSREPSLSFQSFGSGGIELTGELIDASDAVVGEMSYRWFENNIRDGFAQSASTWSDARRGISRFSRRAAKTLSNS